GDGSGTPASVTLFTDVDTNGVTLDENDAIKFDLVFNGKTTTITVDKRTVDAALGSSDGVVADSTDMASVVALALQNAGFDTTRDGTIAVEGAGGVEITPVSDATDATLAVLQSGTSYNGIFFGVSDFDMSNAADVKLDAYIEGLDAMVANVTIAA